MNQGESLIYVNIFQAIESNRRAYQSSSVWKAGDSNISDCLSKTEMIPQELGHFSHPFPALISGKKAEKNCKKCRMEKLHQVVFDLRK